MTIQQPTVRPAMGLTVLADSVIVLPSTVSIGLPLRQLEIQPIDCHPVDREPLSVLFSYSERRAMERAIASHNPIAVTIPLTLNARKCNWLRELKQETPKPGWIWIDEEQTISDLLLERGSRTTAPPYPIESRGFAGIPLADILMDRTPRPERRPDPGLTFPLARFGMCYEGPDSWTVRTLSGDELHIWLIDCYCTEKKAAYDFIWDVLNTSRTLALTIPPPMSGTEDWIGGLAPNTCHSGWIWIDEKKTLNQLLQERGLAKEFPF